MATILRVEHGVPDFEAWKRERFDRDPLNRAASGVRRFRVLRGAAESDFATVDLEFDSLDEAEAFAARIREMWQNVGELSNPSVRIFEEVESTDLYRRTSGWSGAAANLGQIVTRGSRGCWQFSFEG